MLKTEQNRAEQSTPEEGMHKRHEDPFFYAKIIFKK